MDENLKITEIYRAAFRGDGERSAIAFMIIAIIIIISLSLFSHRYNDRILLLRYTTITGRLLRVYKYEHRLAHITFDA